MLLKNPGSNDLRKLKKDKYSAKFSDKGSGVKNKMRKDVLLLPVIDHDLDDI